MAAMLLGVAALGVTLIILDRKLHEIDELRQNSFRITRSVAELNLLAREYDQHGNERPLLQWRTRHQAALEEIDEARTNAYVDLELLERIYQDFRAADAQIAELASILPQLEGNPGAVLRSHHRMIVDELSVRLQSALIRSVKLRDLANQRGQAVRDIGV